MAERPIKLGKSPANDAVVIVGASVAGTRVALDLRRLGYRGPIELIGEEPEAPYDRPPLSKGYLAGSYEPSRLVLLDPSKAAELGISLRLGIPATGLDTSQRAVVLYDGSEVPYGTCVVATGVSPKSPPWHGGHRIYTLRTRLDSQRIAGYLGSGRSLLVIGAGFIGAEVASTAASLGTSVSLVDPLAAPMARIVGEEMGQLLASAHERFGVDAFLGLGVSSLSETPDGVAARLSDGRLVQAEAAVVGIGTDPNVGWLEGSGLSFGPEGLDCDRFCKAVGVDNVYGAGDICRFEHLVLGRSVRVEHWTNAVEQGAAVARNIAEPGSPKPYRGVGYVWSDQYDLKIQIAGHPEVGKLFGVKGDAAGIPPKLLALYGDRNGWLVGSLAVNWPRAAAESRRLVGEGVSASQAASYWD